MIIYRSLIADQRLYALLFGKKSTFWGELKSWHYWTYKNIYLCARLRFLSLCEHFEATYVLKLADRNDHFIYVDDKHVTYQTWYVTCFSYFHTPFVSVTVYSVETSKQSNTVVFNVANWISWEKGVCESVFVCVTVGMFAWLSDQDAVVNWFSKSFQISGSGDKWTTAAQTEPKLFSRMQTNWWDGWGLMC